MGIRHFVFAVNKMDLVKYDQETFRKIEEQIKELQEELSLANVKIIPVSATEGDNVTTKSDNIPWYTGEPLLEYLETVDVREKSEEEGFYMPVQREYAVQTTHSVDSRDRSNLDRFLSEMRS